MAAEPVQQPDTTAGGFARRSVRFVAGQPSWVARAALTAAGIILLLVLLVLIVPTVIVAIIVFLIASAVSWVRRRVAGLTSGRKNVRVLPPPQE